MERRLDDRLLSVRLLHQLGVGMLRRCRADVELLPLAAGDQDGGRLPWDKVGAERRDAGIAGNATAVVHLNALGTKEVDHGLALLASVDGGDGLVCSRSSQSSSGIQLRVLSSHSKVGMVSSGTIVVSQAGQDWGLGSV